jgi:hypothetical protein
MSKVREYYIDKSKTIRKSIIIYRDMGSVHSPIMYLQKPKWVSQEEFDAFVDNMTIAVKTKENGGHK